MSEWYAILNKLNSLLNPILIGLSREYNLPAVTALLLGVLGSTAPCQLSTNASALGLVAQKAEKGKALSAAFALTAGKIFIYTTLGMLTIALGLKLNQAVIPVVKLVRLVLGPLMLLVGLYLLGWLRLNFSLNASINQRMAQYLPVRDNLREFCLGMLSSLAFCPTLFWLFFGMVIPLGLSTRGGILLPGIFALGTALPLLFFTLLIVYGLGKAKNFIRDTAKINRRAQKLSGIIFILAGINETISYWLI